MTTDTYPLFLREIFQLEQKVAAKYFIKVNFSLLTYTFCVYIKNF